VLGKGGDLAGAVEAHEQALALAKKIYGDNGQNVAHTEQLLATTQTKVGAHAKARPHWEHSIAILETFEPTDHPDLAPLLSGLGICLAHLGDVAKAREAFARSLAIREKAFGADSPMLAPVLNNMADTFVRAGSPAEALTLIDRAMA